MLRSTPAKESCEVPKKAGALLFTWALQVSLEGSSSRSFCQKRNHLHSESFESFVKHSLRVSLPRIKGAPCMRCLTQHQTLELQEPAGPQPLSHKPHPRSTTPGQTAPGSSAEPLAPVTEAGGLAFRQARAASSRLCAEPRHLSCLQPAAGRGQRQGPARLSPRRARPPPAP